MYIDYKINYIKQTKDGAEVRYTLYEGEYQNESIESSDGKISIQPVYTRLKVIKSDIVKFKSNLEIEQIRKYFNSLIDSDKREKLDVQKEQPKPQKMSLYVIQD